MTLVVLGLVLAGVGIVLAVFARWLFLRKHPAWWTLRLVAALALAFGLGTVLLLTVHSSHAAPGLTIW